jgi:hypothetical protein
MVTSGWWGIRWGSWLRNEKKKRVYWNHFHETPLSARMSLYVQKPFSSIVDEPPVGPTRLPQKPTIYQFSNPCVQTDLFEHIRQHREFIRAEIYNLVKPHVLKQLSCIEAPEIAIHIRRGDFKYGNPVTPVSYFLDCIRFIRVQTKRSLAVTVFTDAGTEEIGEVLKLENVRLAVKKPDILDILQMSQSRIIILSQSSTFSYWAAFLSEAIVIKPIGDWQGSLRPEEINRHRFEGKVSFDHPSSLKELSKALEKETW